MTTENNDTPTPYERVGELVSIFRREKTWYANFQHKGRQKRQSLKTTDRKEAIRRAQKLNGELIAGTWAHRPADIRVEEAITGYLDHLAGEGRSPKTLTKYRQIFGLLAEQNHVQHVSDIHIRLVEAFRAQRAKGGAKPKTIYTDTVIVRQLVKYCFDRELISKDPLRGLKIHKPKPTEQPCWTREEVDRILAHAPLGIRPALLILAETGMRFGEMAWLTWKDIDWKGSILHVRPKDDWKPKTGDRRSIPLTPRLVEELRNLPQNYRWVVTMPITSQRSEPGRQWTERRLLKDLKRLLRKLGLEGKLHTFRHSFISEALQRGIPTAVVRDWVGHVDPKIIDHYTHIHSQTSQAHMRQLHESRLASTQSNQGEASGSTDHPDSADSAQNQHTLGNKKSQVEEN